MTGCFVTEAELATALDRDGDGYLPVQTGGDDCDEGRADVNPGAPEVCGDGLDNNCDGFPDDDGVGARLWFVDVDGDGYGIESTISACTEPEGYAPEAGDCDDNDSAINPGVDDLCDGIDQDCDGVPDDEVPLVERYRDADGDGIGTVDEVVLACMDVPGFVTLAGDCDDTDPTISPVATDLCDGIDQDCDGVIDDDAVFTQVYRDADGDGIGTDLDTLIDCGAIPGYVLLGGDCDDTDPTISPAAVDLCDGIDQDCDGIADDDALLTLYFQDNDGDGAGNPDVAVETCGSVPGFVFAGGDCDDTDPGISPFILDGCDGIDQDCDGVIDEDAVRTLYFEDLDGDGVGSSTSVEDCTLPAGHALLTGDCDDSDGSIHPGVDDFCDGLDQDCDGAIDEDASFSTWFRDVDGDGLGRTNNPRSTCDGAPSGYVSTAGDCNDIDATITIPAWYPDADGDGVGAGTPSYACNAPADHEAEDGDCDDLDSERYPGNPEVCGTWIDEDCDDATNCRWPQSWTHNSADLVIALPTDGFGVDPIGDLVGGPGADYLALFADRVEIIAGPLPDLLAPYAVIPGCAITTVGDFDGDGQNDLFCRFDRDAPFGADAGIFTALNGFLAPTMTMNFGPQFVTAIPSSVLGPGFWTNLGDGVVRFFPFIDGSATLLDATAAVLVDGIPSVAESCVGTVHPCLLISNGSGVWAFRDLASTAHQTSDAFWSRTFPDPSVRSISIADASADIDGDGTTDVAANIWDHQQDPPERTIQVVYGPLRPSSSFELLFTALPSVSTSLSLAGDIDGDGRLDWKGREYAPLLYASEQFYYGSDSIAPIPGSILQESTTGIGYDDSQDWDGDGRSDVSTRGTMIVSRPRPCDSSSRAATPWA